MTKYRVVKKTETYSLSPNKNKEYFVIQRTYCNSFTEKWDDVREPCGLHVHYLAVIEYETQKGACKRMSEIIKEDEKPVKDFEVMNCG